MKKRDGNKIREETRLKAKKDSTKATNVIPGSRRMIWTSTSPTIQKHNYSVMDNLNNLKTTKIAARCTLQQPLKRDRKTVPNTAQL